jgi:hypothetical protein
MQHDFVGYIWRVILISLMLDTIEQRWRSTLDQSYDIAYAKICPEPEKAVDEIGPPAPPGAYPFNLCFESLSLQVRVCTAEFYQK